MYAFPTKSFSAFLMHKYMHVAKKKKKKKKLQINKVKK